MVHKPLIRTFNHSHTNDTLTICQKTKGLKGACSKEGNTLVCMDVGVSV